MSLVLRSFIAPGFMLDTTDGPAIIFCEGPAGAYASVHQDMQHGHHDHGDKANHRAHFTPTCTYWSISSLLVFTAIFDPALFDVIRPGKVAGYYVPDYQQYTANTHVIRGPPSFS